MGSLCITIHPSCSNYTNTFYFIFLKANMLKPSIKSCHSVAYNFHRLSILLGIKSKLSPQWSFCPAFLPLPPHSRVSSNTGSLFAVPWTHRLAVSADCSLSETFPLYSSSRHFAQPPSITLLYFISFKELIAIWNDCIYLLLYHFSYKTETWRHPGSCLSRSLLSFVHCCQSLEQGLTY